MYVKVVYENFNNRLNKDMMMTKNTL